MRQDNPHLDFPELSKPANPNSGATQGKGAAPPAAVSLTPNVLQARVYSMSMAPPPRHQPQGFKENAQHVGGMAVGAAQAVGSGALAAASYASDSIWQLGDLVTGGYFRDTELMQGVWQRQGVRGEGIVGAVTSPVETVTGIVDDLQARQQQAEALRAAGDFYEAGKVAGTILADISPVGGAVGVVRKLPDGSPVPAARHGADGVAIAQRSTAIQFTQKQLDKKAKHSNDFGVDTTKKNPETLKKYQESIEEHMNNSATKKYGTYIHSPESSVYYNPATNNVVIVNKDGFFESGWKLSPGSRQYLDYINDGKLF